MTTLPPTWMCHACGYREYVHDDDWERAGVRLHAHETECPACLAQADTASSHIDNLAARRRLLDGFDQANWRRTGGDAHDRPYWRQVAEALLMTAAILGVVAIAALNVVTPAARLAFVLCVGGAYLLGLACGVELGRRP